MVPVMRNAETYRSEVLKLKSKISFERVDGQNSTVDEMTGGTFSNF